MNKKGQIFDQLGALGVGIAGLAIILVVTFLIISNAKTSMISSSQVCDSSYFYNSTANNCQLTGAVGLGAANISSFTTAWNATNTMGSAVQTIPGWVPLIVIAVVGAILLGLVAMFKR